MRDGASLKGKARGACQGELGDFSVLHDQRRPPSEGREAWPIPIALQAEVQRAKEEGGEPEEENPVPRHQGVSR